MMLALLCAGVALANGDLSHLWITARAVDRLPAGELRDLVADPAYADMLENGSIFPDGGYAVNDGYGEAAHWEPFQRRYAAWIRATHGPPPYTGEAAEHAAFLLGMASHGMADQVFDALYMERARYEDAASDWENDSMDEATDAAFAASVGPQDYGALWVPEELMAQLMAEAGHEVEADTIHLGQVLVRVAAQWAWNAGSQPEVLADYQRRFPWATGHQLDVTVRGTPLDEADAVARYWQVLWRALEDPAEDVGEVLWAWPGEGAVIPATAADNPQSRLAVVFSRGLLDPELEETDIAVTDEGGQPISVEPRLFYGDDSHVLLLAPTDGWPPPQVCTLRLPGALPFSDPATLPDEAPFTRSFRSGPLPPESGCAARPGAGRLGLALLGLVGLIGRRGKSG
ncbi:MAG: zinc dependent phospholipase C family protein [Pseudomonadota bacterium]